MIKEFLDFSYIFNNGEKWKFWGFICIYVLFALNIVPVDIPMALALFLFAIAPVHLAFFLFSFYALFENVSVFSFGITLNLLVQVLLVLKVFGTITKDFSEVVWRGGFLKLSFFIYFLFYGIVSSLQGDGFTGISIALRLFIAFYVAYYIQQTDDYYSLWKAIFHIMYISTLISVLYGLFHDTSVERYISGLETSYAMQLYGSLGTTRLGMFTVCSLTYPLYFVSCKYLKWILTATMVVLTCLTVSITAIATLVLFFIIYFISIGGIKQMLQTGILCLFLLTATYGIWSRLPFLQPILYRMEYTERALESGNMDEATTNRSELSRIYLDEFRKSSTIEQLIGRFKANNLNFLGRYSHNSYIDMLSFSGVLGILLLWLYAIKNILLYRDTEVFFPVLTLKLIMLLPAFTVSIFGTVYWSWFIFI